MECWRKQSVDVHILFLVQLVLWKSLKWNGVVLG